MLRHCRWDPFASGTWPCGLAVASGRMIFAVVNMEQISKAYLFDSVLS